MVLCVLFGCVWMMNCGSSFADFVYSDFLFVHYSEFVVCYRSSYVCPLS